METAANVKPVYLSRLDRQASGGINPPVWCASGFTDLTGTVLDRNIKDETVSAVVSEITRVAWGLPFNTMTDKNVTAQTVSIKYLVLIFEH